MNLTIKTLAAAVVLLGAAAGAHATIVVCKDGTTVPQADMGDPARFCSNHGGLLPPSGGSVPEPATLALLGLAAAGAAVARRARK